MKRNWMKIVLLFAAGLLVGAILSSSIVEARYSPSTLGKNTNEILGIMVQQGSDTQDILDRIERLEKDQKDLLYKMERMMDKQSGDIKYIKDDVGRIEDKIH